MVAGSVRCLTSAFILENQGGNTVKIHSRQVSDADLQEMRSLLLKDGPNEWNYITEESIEHQFQLIRNNNAVAVLAEDNGIHGFAVLIYREASPAKLCKYDNLSAIAYIADVVVSLRKSGGGLGTRLLKKSIELAGKAECTKVYIERHEENPASAGMMRKAGFEVVETFFDPGKRDTGSRKTAVLVKNTLHQEGDTN